ncbi:hypothetical protein [Nevskia soli]|uniref:hypothetical protein n=1 Tax=Nevskia soli TaxID=418856 RepID=UPI0004A76524|nr:hypothetical protein [Nevskia soli]
MFEALGQLGALDPWLFRGWLFLFSPGYRAERRRIWKSRGLLYSALDIAFSATLMLLELAVIVVLVIWGIARVAHGA